MRARRATGIGSAVVVMVVALGTHTSAADALRAHGANDTRGRRDVRSVSHRHG
jgi:hypothetical protein